MRELLGDHPRKPKRKEKVTMNIIILVHLQKDNKGERNAKPSTVKKILKN